MVPTINHNHNKDRIPSIGPIDPITFFFALQSDLSQRIQGKKSQMKKTMQKKNFHIYIYIYIYIK